MYHKVIDDVLETYPWIMKQSPQKVGSSPSKSHHSESKELPIEQTPPTLKYARMTLSEMIYTYYLQLYGLRTTAELVSRPSVSGFCLLVALSKLPAVWKL